MNQNQPYMDIHSSHVSASQQYGPLPASGPGPNMSQYGQSMMPHQGSYPSTPASYPTYSYSNGVISPQSQASQHGGSGIGPAMQSSMLPHLPAMNAGGGASHNYGGPSPYIHQTQQPFDTTGQVAPPGMKPKVTATLWEDEGSLCFQVEAKGICVARREDNHFINGTKLLNVAGMTRGRRDGILKSEKTRNVVKIGPMHLKGVWIPYERALEFANREKITDLLYPLFVHNISGLLYDPANQHRNVAVGAPVDRRRLGDPQVPRPLPMSQPPALQHHNTMSNAVGTGQNQSAQHAGPGRPSLDRAHTFPTPPTSASSVINGQSGASYSDWNGSAISGGIGNAQQLSIDTGLSNARSMPTTPATTPPGNGISSMPPYPASQSYESTKQYYSAPPPQQSYVAHQDLDNKYGQNSTPYVKTEMGPPTGRGTGLHDADQQDFKGDPYGSRPTSSQISHHGGDGEATQVADQDYSNGAYTANRSSYGYGSTGGLSSMQADHPQMSPAINGSPNQHPGSGHVTPRTANPSQPSWASGYHTPPRQPQSSNLYNIMSDSRSSGANGASDGYNGSNYTTSSMNGTPGTKRGREDDDHANGSSASGLEPAFDLKRRRTMREDGVHSPVALPAMASGIKAGGGPRRR